MEETLDGDLGQDHGLGEGDRLHAYSAYQRDERGEPNLQGLQREREPTDTPAT